MSAAPDCLSGNNLLKEFSRFYEIIPAIDSQLQQEVFRLRYQVYCEYGRVPGFEHLKNTPGCIETDKYDHRSCHTLLKYLPTNSYVGTVRLVLANIDNPEQPFPIEEHVPYVRNHPLAPIEDQRTCLAEISRLIVTRHLPRPTTNPRSGPILETKYQHITILNIAILGLFKAIVRMASDHDIQYLYAAMEPALVRQLRRFGIRLTNLGPTGEYYGKRQPQIGKSNPLMHSIYAQRPDVWAFLTNYGTVRPAPRIQSSASCLVAA